MKKIKKAASKSLVAVKTDAEKYDANLSNLMTNLGIIGRDKRMSATSNFLIPTLSELEIDYQSDDIYARIVDRPPEEMMREGYTINLDGTKEEADLIEKLVAEMAAHDINHKIEMGEKYARHLGGSGLYVGVTDGLSPTDPLDLSKIRKIEHFTLLDRFELLSSGIIDTDVRSKNFGKPEYYVISSVASSSNAIRIHHSRIIRFEGIELPRRIAALFDYWGQPIASRIKNVLTNYHTANDSVASIVQDFTRLIFKMQELPALVAMGADGDKILAKRLDLAAQTNSIINALVIRDDEEIKDQSRQVTGLDGLLKIIKERLLAATDMPHTILFGESASGLGATGDSEKRDWYDHIKNLQKSKIEPKLRQIITLFMAAKSGAFNGKIMDFCIEFNPLWQMSEKEQAEIRKIQSETDKNYYDMQALESEEIALSRFGSGKYSTETKLDLELRNRLQNQPEEEGPDLEDPNFPKDLPEKNPENLGGPSSASGVAAK